MILDRLRGHIHPIPLPPRVCSATSGSSEVAAGGGAAGVSCSAASRKILPPGRTNDQIIFIHILFDSVRFCPILFYSIVLYVIMCII